MGAWHDAITAGETLLFTVLAFWLMLGLVWRAKATTAEVVVGAAVGVLATCLTGLATSVGPSGTMLRAREGLPHFYASHAASVPLTAGDVVWAYFALDLAVWCPVAVIGTILVSKAIGPGRSWGQTGATITGIRGAPR